MEQKTDKEKLLDFAKLLQEIDLDVELKELRMQMVAAHAIAMINRAASFIVEEVGNMR